MKTYTEQEMRQAIEIAFRKGELWGTTYQGWFFPSNKDWVKKFEENVEFIFDESTTLTEKLIDTWSK